MRNLSYIFALACTLTVICVDGVNFEWYREEAGRKLILSCTQTQDLADALVKKYFAPAPPYTPGGPCKEISSPWP